MATPASAADYDASNEWGSFTWGDPYLWDDVNGNGLPDVGDTVVYPFELDLASGKALWDSSALPAVERGTRGTSGWSAAVTVEGSMLGADGSGPLLSGATIVLLDLGSYDRLPLDVPAPPVLYTNVTTISVDVEETQSDTTDGKPAEGDRVRLAYTIPEGTRGGIVSGTLEGVYFGTVDVEGGDLVVYTTWFPAVTLADMLAGEVSLPATSITWQFRDGTQYKESFGAQTNPTEAIASAYDADVSFEWRDATRTTARGPGEGEVGDRIDYTFEMTNTGNVTINNASLKRVSPEILPIQSVNTDGLALAPGDTLLSSALTPDYFTSDDGRFGPYVIEQADLARGYVDFEFEALAYADPWAYVSNSSAFTTTFTKRVWLRAPVTNVSATATPELIDSNGDGIGQIGEQIKVTYQVTNGSGSEQDIQIRHVNDTLPVGPFDDLDDVVLAPGEFTTHVESFTIDTHSLGNWTSHAYVAYAKLTENADGSVYAPQAVVPIRAYVAPTTTLDVSHSYVDANGDGAPSIGDTVTFTSTVENEGTYPLTGIALSDAASDVAGTLPPDASLAPGASLTWDVVHELTAADFARGSLTYDVTVDADGLVQLGDSDTVASVAFAALETDLTDPAEGGIAVCVDGVSVAELLPGDEFTVHAPDCAGEQLGGDDAVYVFSTPLELGTGAGTLVLPADVELGAHRVAAYDSAGVLIGWVALDVVAAPVAIDAMPVTGPDSSTWTLAWVALLALVLGGAAVALPRRR